MNNLKQIIQNINENGYLVQPFGVMREAFEYYKRTLLLTATTMLLFILLASFIGSYAMIQTGFLDATATPEEIQIQLLGLVDQLTEPPLLFYYLAITIVVNALTSILVAGYYKINSEAALNKTPKFLSVFKYFFSIKGVYIFIIQLVINLAGVFISTLLKDVNLEMVSVIITWLINMLTVFTTPLIIFGKMSPFTALKTSINVVNKQPIPIMLTLILNYFLASSGLFFFLIGVLFTVPYLFSVYFTLYKQIIGYNIEEN